MTSVHPLDALGNPVRRDILRKLRARSLSVGELADKFPVTRPAISRHLKTLQDAGLVEARREGARAVYSVRIQGLTPLREFFEEFWDAALARLEELSRR